MSVMVMSVTVLSVMVSVMLMSVGAIKDSMMSVVELMSVNPLSDVSNCDVSQIVSTDLALCQFLSHESPIDSLSMCVSHCVYVCFSQYVSIVICVSQDMCQSLSVRMYVCMSQRLSHFV